MKKLWFVAGGAIAAAALAIASSSHAAAGIVFKLAPSSGYVVLNDVIERPGHHAVSHFTGKRAAACLNGTAQDDYCRQYLENDPTGDAFVDYVSTSHWRFFTKIMGGTATDLTGNVDPTGAFMMSGTHALSGAQLFMVGKVKFAKGTLNPQAISGTLYFTSTTIQEFGQVAFKSVGTQ